jgi:signal transduction histidine kinase/CheY-like chemotaxis protein
MDLTQIETNINLEKALRRASLLSAAAEVSQNLTRILNIDELLPKTVEIICNAYGFYYVGVFLIDQAGEFAVLKAGRGEPGRIMIENNHKLAVGGNSMIGACTALNQARISLDVDTEKVWYPNPVLPDTRSEMALPLAVGDRVFGAVTVQSVEPAAFTDEDIASLQAMANQLAIALDNARQRRELEEAHAQIVRAKTFEAIATATGDAIHWIGNKAEPITPSVKRIRYDLQMLVCALAKVLAQAAAGDASGQMPLNRWPLTQLLFNQANAIQADMPELLEEAEKLLGLPLNKLEQRLSLASTLEDLQIIEDAALLIMKIKEELIGPAREQAPRPAMVHDVLKDAIHSLDIPADRVIVESLPNLPLTLADPIQLNRVFTNLLKNAREATEETEQPQIRVRLQLNSSGSVILVTISDNGIGIPTEDLDKVWITFHTTKGVKGHAGLGLPACRLILEQMGGHISVDSKWGHGTTVLVELPVYQEKESKLKLEPSRGKILLIDDNDPWRQFAEATLKAAGYKVTVANPTDTIENYHQPDLILIDDILAEGDSLSVLQTVAKAGAIAKTIAFSSNPRVERTKVRMLLGLRNLLPKPYTQPAFLEDVKRSLENLK